MRGGEEETDRPGVHANRIAAVVVGAYVVMWVPAIFVRLVDVPFAVGVVLLVLAALIGGYGGYHEGRTFTPFDHREHRDAVLGWTFVSIAIGIIGSLAMPMPWAMVAAAGWGLAVFTVARALLEVPAEPSSRESADGAVADSSAR